MWDTHTDRDWYEQNEMKDASVVTYTGGLLWWQGFFTGDAGSDSWLAECLAPATLAAAAAVVVGGGGGVVVLLAVVLVLAAVRLRRRWYCENVSRRYLRWMANFNVLNTADTGRRHTDRLIEDKQRRWHQHPRRQTHRYKRCQRHKDVTIDRTARPDRPRQRPGWLAVVGHLPG